MWLVLGAYLGLYLLFWGVIFWTECRASPEPSRAQANPAGFSEASKMTDTTKIEPALKPERWDRLLHRTESVLTVENALNHELSVMAEGDRHAIAALALYGQRFGFTWKDAEHLYGLANVMRQALRMPQDAAQLEEMADRIVALLPQRET